MAEINKENKEQNFENPIENIFDHIWRKEINSKPFLIPKNTVLKKILDKEEISEEEEQLADTLFKWLGSPVGILYLKKVFNDIEPNFLYFQEDVIGGLGDLIERHLEDYNLRKESGQNS